jgi:hypothetical protein
MQVLLQQQQPKVPQQGSLLTQPPPQDLKRHHLQVCFWQPVWQGRDDSSSR